VKYFVGYATTLVMLTGIDMLWLGIIAKQMYRTGIGHLMAEKPIWAVAALFYPVFALGLMIFAVVPNEGAAHWSKASIAAAMFGFFAYATYDITNLATLERWPWRLSLIDMTWGTAVSAVAVLPATFVMKHFFKQ
jgi:uncharacterized membrane protein